MYGHSHASIPPALPFHEHVRQQLSGDRDIHLFPEPAKLKGVWLAPGESALALVDATVLGNASSGVLLTTHALRVLGDSRQVDVSAITSGPHFPHGDAHPGYVDTLAGPLYLSKYTEEVTARIVRVVEAVVAYARGDRASPYATLASKGSVSSAAAATLLASPQFTPPWNVNRFARRGVQQILAGLDVRAGEAPLAILDETTGGSADEGVVVTTHATYVRNETASERDMCFSVPHAWLVSIGMKGGLLGQGVELRTHQGARPISLIRNSESARTLAAFYNAILAIPPHARHDACPLPRDPTLARRLDEAPWSPAMRADMDARASLQHVHESWGRTKSAGWLVSPLSLGDLRAALTLALGPPAGRAWDGVHETLDFSVSSGGIGAGAIASSVVGIALLATVGIGWVSTPRGPRVTALRCRLRELGASTGISLHAMSASGEVHGSDVPEKLSAALVPIERDILMRRVDAGLEAPPDALLYPAAVQSVQGTSA